MRKINTRKIKRGPKPKLDKNDKNDDEFVVCGVYNISVVVVNVVIKKKQSSIIVGVVVTAIERHTALSRALGERYLHHQPKKKKSDRKLRVEEVGVCWTRARKNA